MNYNIFELIKNIKLTDIISTTNKTLNVVKKSIPVYKEIRPYMRKEKSIFIKAKNDQIDEIKASKPLKKEREITYNDTLTFFN